MSTSRPRFFQKPRFRAMKVWMSEPSASTLHQFSQLGVPLQSQSISLPSTQWYGMEFDITPVPEPASWALVGVGLAFLLLARRR